MNIKKCYPLIGLLLLLFILPINIALADNVLNKFDIKKAPSEYQINKDVSYFDLLLKPEQEEHLTVILENNSNEKIKLNLSINKAITNQNGVVEYSGANKDNSKTAPYNIEELITLSDKEVSLAPSEKKEVTLTVKMPKNEFSGTLAGALYVIEIPQSEATNTIRNILSREIAILLSNSTKEITPNIIFNDVKAIHNNERNAIEINMENVTATYIKNVTLTYDIKHKEQIFMNGEQNSIKIAPNSLVSFVIPMNDKEFLAGDYSAQIKVESDNNVWNETLQFSVKKEEANKLNNSNVASEEEKSLPWSTIILSLALITFIGLFFYLIWKNKQLKQKIKKKKKKRKIL
jgi:hypothetical protein